MRARLTVSLSALCDNYRFLCEQTAPAQCGVVVKADAYGLGMAAVAPALYNEGARIFFVAQTGEGIALRSMLEPDAVIYVLNGLLPDSEQDFLAHDLRPVLNRPDSVRRWRDKGRHTGNNKPAPCAIQLDTGLNRLGLTAGEVGSVDLDGLDVAMVMSHLACADTPDHLMNTVQRQRFEEMVRYFPDAQKSLAASDGIFCGPEFHFDLARPGAALYGLNPVPRRVNPMKAVINLTAPVLGVHHVEQDGFVGYAATRSVRAGQRIAAIGLGYADGFFRSYSNQANLYWQGTALPVLGRVSMDMILVALDNLPENSLHTGDYVEIIGPSQTVDQLAASSGTISYEIIATFGPRLERIYTV